MIMKVLKPTLIIVAIVGILGGLLFGGELVSYVKSTCKSMQTSVKDSVPIEFELQRAQDMVEEIIPEMHANIRLIATEEVEVAQLREDIAAGTDNLAKQKVRVAQLRQAVSYRNVAAGSNADRERTVEELARRFEHLREAEMIMQGKQRLLVTREKSLAAALQALDRTRSQKLLLEDKIKTLEGQHRLIQAAAMGSSVSIDNSKLAQTEKVINQIRKRLDIAERVLAHESRFVEDLPQTTLDEQDLLSQVDEYFAAPAQQPAQNTAVPALPAPAPLDTVVKAQP